MAKKKQRKSQVSKGIVGRPAGARTSVGVKRRLNQLEAFEKGKNVVLTVPNRDENETNRRMIRVNAKDYWGSTQAEKKKQKQLANES